MKPYLRILRQTFLAGQDYARLPVAGNFLRVLVSSEPISFVLGDESTVELSPGMGVFLDEAQAFQDLRITRIYPIPGEPLSLQIAVGFQPADRPPVLTDNRAVAVIHDNRTANSATLTEIALNLPLGTVRAIAPGVTGRFLPRYSARRNLLDVVAYTPDDLAAPTITGATPAALNLLAPALEGVEKRVVRLLTGAAATLATTPTGCATPGHAFILDAANPERVIDGAQALFGLAAADATLSVFEVLRPASGVVTAPGTASASLSPAELAMVPPATLSVVFTAQFTGAFIPDHGLKSVQLMAAGLATGADWAATVVKQDVGNTTDHTEHGGVFSVSAGPIAASQVFASAATNVQTPVAPNTAYLVFTAAGDVLALGSTPSRLLTGTGSFELPELTGVLSGKKWKGHDLGYYPYHDRDPSYIRLAIPYDGAAPYYEQYDPRTGLFVRGS